MVEATTVWEVELRPGGSMDGRKGSLRLEVADLVFEPTGGASPRRIALSDVRKARRLRGSPVLLVIHTMGGDTARTAYYFSKPPPLHGSPVPTQERPSVLAMRENTKRHVRRQNVGYLGTSNRQKKELVASWERAVRAAMGDGKA